MSLFRAIAKIGIDASEYEAGLKKAESGMEGWAKRIGGYLAGAFTVGALVEFTKTVAHAAGEIGDLSDQLGITVEQVQALQRAAEHSGVAFDKYAAALSKIRKLKADAAAGDATANGIFAKTGLNSRTDDFTLLQQIGGLPDAKAFEILDAKSAKLKNSLSDINKIPKIELMTSENVQVLDRAGDALGDMMRSLKAMASIPIAGVARAILDGSWVQNNRAWKREAALPIPTGRIQGRDSGEFFGPTEGEAQIQELNRIRNTKSARFSTMEDLLGRGRFRPINMGDRSNVGGFFGPNADLNSKMQRLGSNVESMAKAMDEVAKIMKGATQSNQP